MVCLAFVDRVAYIERILLIEFCRQIVHVQVRGYLTCQSRTVALTVPLEITQFHSFQILMILQDTEHVAVTLVNDIITDGQAKEHRSGGVAATGLDLNRDTIRYARLRLFRYSD